MSNKDKQAKGLRMMRLMSDLPDGTVLDAKAETASVPAPTEKRENWFLRMMSSPAVAAVLSLVVALVVVAAIVRAGSGGYTTPAGNKETTESESQTPESQTPEPQYSIQCGDIVFHLAGLEEAYAYGSRPSFQVWLTNEGKQIVCETSRYDFAALQFSFSAEGVDGLSIRLCIDAEAEYYVVHKGEDGPVISVSTEGFVPGDYDITAYYKDISVTFENALHILPYEEDDTVVYIDPPEPTDAETLVITDPIDSPTDYDTAIFGSNQLSNRRCFTDENGNVHIENGIYNEFVLKQKFTECTEYAILNARTDSYILFSSESNAYFPDEVSAVLKQYDDAFFETHRLLLIPYAATSGSDRYTVSTVDTVSDGSRVTVYVEMVMPELEIGTCDMAMWVAVIPILKSDGGLPNAVYVREVSADAD